MSPELSPPFDVVAVGAHPDDVEIAVGGTLARLVQQGYRVGIVDLTNGEPTPGSPAVEVRLAEAREPARILGVHARETLSANIIKKRAGTNAVHVVGAIGCTQPSHSAIRGDGESQGVFCKRGSSHHVCPCSIYFSIRTTTNDGALRIVSR